MGENSEKRPTLLHERRVGYPDIRVAGVDEVGRGCLAGIVVAGAVILPSRVDRKSHPWIGDVTDSKCLRTEEREKLAPLIEAWAVSYSVAFATVEEIDRINIFHASHLAMSRAVEGLQIQPQHLLVDGKFLPRSGFSCGATAIIEGDLKCLSIACASILAKVWRDRWMKDQDTVFPGYGFAENKGYSTPFHKKALRALGATPLHRKSFAPVSEVLGQPALGKMV